MLATANTGKIGRGFGKNAGEWTRRVEIGKEEIPGSKRSMYSYILTYSPTPGLKGRTFKLCVLTRWDFNFCIRSSPLRVRCHNGFKKSASSVSETARIDNIK